MTDTSRAADVIVIGAGAAGLAAARLLSSRGLHVDIVEARDRIGGRIFTVREPSLPYALELGAEFMQGVPSELLELAAQAHLAIVEMQGERWQAGPGSLEPHPSCGPDVEGQAARFVLEHQRDHSLREFLDAALPGAELSAMRDVVATRVQDYDAASPDLISIGALVRQWRAEAAIQGQRAFRIVNGYDNVVNWLVGNLNAVLHLNTVARELRWQRGHVELVASDGPNGTPARMFRAKRAVITLPVGVLRARDDAPGALCFSPPLADKRAALAHLEMGNVVKVLLRLRYRLWDDAQPRSTSPVHRGPSAMGFLHAHHEPFAAWWTANPFYAPVLTAWSAGPAARTLQGLAPQAIADRAIESAGRIFGMGRARVEDNLVSWHFHDWIDDPFSRGAYSFIAVGGLAAQETLARPVEGTLFFAGEATERHGHHAMVHGALAEGRRAAQDVLASLGPAFDHLSSPR